MREYLELVFIVRDHFRQVCGAAKPEPVAQLLLAKEELLRREAAIPNVNLAQVASNARHVPHATRRKHESFTRMTGRRRPNTWRAPHLRCHLLRLAALRGSFDGGRHDGSLPVRGSIRSARLPPIYTTDSRETHKEEKKRKEKRTANAKS